MTWKLSGQSQIITGDEVLEVQREGSDIPGSIVYLDGKPVRRQPIIFTIVCTVQPLSGRDLLMVPEGDRISANYWVWSNQTQKPLKLNDLIRREDEVYQVQESSDWGSYTRARMMLVDTGPLQVDNDPDKPADAICDTFADTPELPAIVTDDLSRES